MSRICRECSSIESKDNPFVKTKENLCKKCRTIYDKSRLIIYRKKRRELSQIYYARNAEKIRLEKKLKRKQDKEKDPEGYKKYCTNANKKSVEKSKAQNIEAYRKNRALIRKRYITKNRKKHLEYNRNLYKTHINFRLSVLLRHRIRSSLKKTPKFKKTAELLGCSIDFLKTHLQQTALTNGYKNFNINTFDGNKYHIDHIIPCSSFNLSKEEEQKKCFHYSNLQILDAKSNKHKWKFLIK